MDPSIFSSFSFVEWWCIGEKHRRVSFWREPRRGGSGFQLSPLLLLCLLLWVVGVLSIWWLECTGGISKGCDVILFVEFICTLLFSFYFGWTIASGIADEGIWWCEIWHKRIPAILWPKGLRYFPNFKTMSSRTSLCLVYSLSSFQTFSLNFTTLALIQRIHRERPVNKARR